MEAVVAHRIVIPGWHPTPLNVLLRNRWVAARRKKKDRHMISTAAWVVNMQSPRSIKATGPRRVRLTITLGKGQRACDPDAYWKSTLDALVECELLVDDNRQNAVLDPVEFVRARWPGTAIELIDLYGDDE